MAKQKKGDLTRAIIITKSLPLFAVKGYFNTSVNDILKVTGLTKGGLYAHFDSKESIWYAVYDKAVVIWRYVLFNNLRSISDPLKRTQVLIERHMRDYIGFEVFKGGCFFVNSLIEVSGQSESMTNCILKGFESYENLITSWIQDAREKNILVENINPQAIGNFIVTCLYGSAALYSGSRKPEIWENSILQLNFFINSLKK
ncbi:MAG: TetR/AcrR family transcriptional regulator [Proteobacteria bacterium]|nr:TetR/AcrR family transcriptional regulator [Pseudomonadota bacterium]MBU1584515.1 TetR/AcrR family transcriptional regulator [Pseudomonadota bacterium]MBU2451772.1 TetR/AcrR family transcriptional regulator [Pseudomonadota bacterium]MBU2630969.1 TetR/AcrR family transcriptional regulator [Pseudomonadota bacterium]